MSIKSVVAGLLVAAGLASTAQAAPLNFELTEYTGTNSRVHILVEQQDANTLKFTLTQPIQAGEILGEFRAFYFQVANESLLSSLTITGPKVTATAKSANAVSQVGGNDTNLNGGGFSYALDVGVAFGTAGQDNPAINSTTFTVAYAGGLDLATFFPTGADNVLFAARLKPFPGDGSSKLACDYPCGSTSSSSSGGPGREEIPAPASLALLGLGLTGLGLRRRKA